MYWSSTLAAPASSISSWIRTTGNVTAKGLCERIGLDGRLTHKVPATGKKVEKDIPMPTHKEAIEAVMAILVDPA